MHNYKLFEASRKTISKWDEEFYNKIFVKYNELGYTDASTVFKYAMVVNQDDTIHFKTYFNGDFQNDYNWGFYKEGAKTSNENRPSIEIYNPIIDEKYFVTIKALEKNIQKGIFFPGNEKSVKQTIYEQNRNLYNIILKFNDIHEYGKNLADQMFAPAIDGKYIDGIPKFKTYKSQESDINDTSDWGLKNKQTNTRENNSTYRLALIPIYNPKNETYYRTTVENIRKSANSTPIRIPQSDTNRDWVWNDEKFYNNVYCELAKSIDADVLNEIFDYPKEDKKKNGTIFLRFKTYSSDGIEDDVYWKNGGTSHIKLRINGLERYIQACCVIKQFNITDTRKYVEKKCKIKWSDAKFVRDIYNIYKDYKDAKFDVEQIFEPILKKDNNGKKYIHFPTYLTDEGPNAEEPYNKDCNWNPMFSNAKGVLYVKVNNKGNVLYTSINALCNCIRKAQETGNLKLPEQSKTKNKLTADEFIKYVSKNYPEAPLKDTDENPNLGYLRFIYDYDSEQFVPNTSNGKLRIYKKENYEYYPISEEQFGQRDTYVDSYCKRHNRILTLLARTYMNNTLCHCPDCLSERTDNQLEDAIRFIPHKKRIYLYEDTTNSLQIKRTIQKHRFLRPLINFTNNAMDSYRWTNSLNIFNQYKSNDVSRKQMNLTFDCLFRKIGDKRGKLMAVECQGPQHFHNSFRSDIANWIRGIKRDMFKYRFCINNHISIYYYLPSNWENFCSY